MRKTSPNHVGMFIGEGMKEKPWEKSSLLRILRSHLQKENAFAHFSFVVISTLKSGITKQ